MESIEVVGKHLGFEEKQLATWAALLQRHPDRETVGLELVIVALRFEDRDVENLQLVLVALAVAALGLGSAQRALERAGLDSKRSLMPSSA